jgi:hypothetical protein
MGRFDTIRRAGMTYQSREHLIDADATTAEPPYDFGEVGDDVDPDASGDAYVLGEYGDLIRQPGGAAAEAKTEGPKPWVKPAALLLSAVFVALTAWNLSRLVQDPPAPPAPTPTQVKQALYLGVMRADAYRRAHGVTPQSLSDLNLPEPAYAYRRIDSRRYALSFGVGATRLEYDSQVPKASFFGSPKELLQMEK